MEFLDFFFKFIGGNQSTLKPLGNQAFELNVGLVMDGPKARVDITEQASDFRRHKDDLKKLAEKHTSDQGGALVVVFAGKDLFRLEYDGRGDQQIDLVFLQGKAKDFFTEMGQEITQLREAFIATYSDDDLADLIDLTSDFLESRQGSPFSYTLRADGKPFLRGTLEDQDIDVQLLDILVYIKTLLFGIEGANFLNVKLTSPMDILKLFESAQGALRHLATTYQIAGLKARVGMAGQPVFSAGRDVKPNFTSAFGPINLQLESIFKILSSALSTH